MGYLVTWADGGGSKHTKEFDTLSCNHCQKVITKDQWKQVGHWCFCCAKPCCGEDNPVCYTKSLNGCVPFMKRIEQEMARNRFYEAVGGA